MVLQAQINFISKLCGKFPLSPQLISGQCSHFIPSENTAKSKVSCGYILRGYKIGTLARNGLTKQLP